MFNTIHMCFLEIVRPKIDSLFKEFTGKDNSYQSTKLKSNSPIALQQLAD